MSQIVYLKTACERCSGHIEYPSELGGQSIECPHCHQATPLPPPIPSLFTEPPPSIPPQQFDKIGAEINIVRSIKPKKGMYIAEGRGEYIGKNPYGEGREGHFVLFKIMWGGWLTRSQSLMALPDLCLGVSRLSDKKVQSEARWGAFSTGQESTPILFGALGGVIAGAVRTALADTKGLSGFVVYYNNEVQSTGGFVAAASPDIVEEIFSVIPEEMIIPIPGAP